MEPALLRRHVSTVAQKGQHWLQGFSAFLLWIGSLNLVARLGEEEEFWQMEDDTYLAQEKARGRGS